MHHVRVSNVVEIHADVMHLSLRCFLSYDC